MNFTSTLRIAAIGVALSVTSSAVLAKAAATPQTHHCKLPDGSMDMKQTKKQCLSSKGTWAKDAASPSAPAAPATAAAPTK